MANNIFSSFLKKLRREEEVILFQKIFEIDEKDKKTAINFLRTEFENEAFDFPFQAPKFSEKAAFWAAMNIYITAQLILYREHKPEDIRKLIAEYDKEISPSEILSADLVLRFLPDMIRQLKMIDTEDELISVLEKNLTKFHYSGVNYPLEITKLDFEIIKNDPCLHQLYVNRIIENKNGSLANHVAFRDRVAANLSIYKNDFWAGLQFEINN